MPIISLTNQELAECRDALLMLDRAKEEKRLPKFTEPGKVCYNLAYTLRKVRAATEVFEEARRGVFVSLKRDQDQEAPTATDLQGARQTEFMRQIKELNQTQVEVEVRPVTLKELGWDSGEFPIAACSVLLGPIIHAPDPA